uniref:DUF8117 domain-containing protein n=1 Tax=Acrobeloides nanus TaxID=290746 RepID=A0A914DFQ5_9BILA
MGLPVVSMEDEELFPKISKLDISNAVAELNLDDFDKLYSTSNDELWWSRLVIAIRERLEILRGRIDDKDPFIEPETAEAFTNVFGQPNYVTYRIANAQVYAYITFMRVLGTLLARWVDEQDKTKKKGIRFDKDPEWQPADRVVIFEEFFKGNRTWVLYDFDRHVLNFWRPKGTNVIFGDRYIEKKRRAGLDLCSYCGMLEQAPKQFQMIENHRFCSEQCLAAMIDEKVIKI